MQYNVDAFLRYVRKLVYSWIMIGTMLIDVIVFIVAVAFRPVDPPKGIYLGIAVIGYFVANVQIFLESDKRESDLNQRIAQLESRRPLLKPMFSTASGNLRSEAVLSVRSGPLPPRDYETEVDEKIQDLRRKRPPMEESFFVQRNTEYLTEVAAYKETYARFVRYSHEYECQRDRLVFLEFALCNLGTSPASDVTLQISLPPEVEYGEERVDRWEEWKEYGVSPPGEPQTTINMISGSFPYIVPDIPRTDPFDADIEVNSDGTVITYRVESLAPGSNERRFEAVPLWFGRVADNEVVTLRTRVTASELDSPLIDCLSLTLRVLSHKECEG